MMKFSFHFFFRNNRYNSRISFLCYLNEKIAKVPTGWIGKNKGYKKYSLILILGGALGNLYDRIFFGAKDTKNGVCGSLIDLTNASQFNHRIIVTGGVLERQCQEILRSFFKLRR